MDSPVHSSRRRCGLAMNAALGGDIQPEVCQFGRTRFSISGCLGLGL